MHIHHLNCISTCPLGGKLMDDRTESLIRRGHLVCHCLLVELNDSLVLIDTGLGLQDVANPQTRLSRFFLTLIRPEFREEMTAVRQVQRLGFDPRDVHHIILTHLDFDHAGGLDDFPNAQVHMLQSERDDAFAQRSWLDRQRFRPQQWSTRGNWHVYPSAQGETWFGFDSVRDLEGIPPEILMVPLLGHTLGHTGIAVKIGDQWLFHTGDAYFFYKEMDFSQPWCTPGLRFYQWMMEKNRQSRLQNQMRLRQLRHDQNDRITIFCGHDVVEFERLPGRSAEVPAEQLML
ncbi:MBL fold metallo-hydrolase [Nitrosomonas sp. Nm166]|uniref:MBL fold metallo-hydrolase n=1 Tax=Nitrosomonas sp. Nm166 TaxID=1881054 RepID=UPI0008E3730C|nr:MBL fold metallo-hydrolase [Nitrosomonas sp. Nm166]SFE98071.1 Glyoxylase, beta-lactamase superfamily II [Nitrosomonas sp. Nm166]